MMKIKTIILQIIFMIFPLSGSAFFAQESNYKLITKELNTTQKELLQKETALMKANRAAFKSSLTKEQLAILKDKTISKTEIKQRLMATFTKTQRELVKNQQLQLRESRESFRKTLTKAQRKVLKQRIDKIRNTRDRGELKNGPRERNVDGKKVRPKGIRNQ